MNNITTQHAAGFFSNIIQEWNSFTIAVQALHLLDQTLIFGFLILIFSVGIWYSTGIKDLRAYALGNRTFSTFALVSTVVATYASGSGFIVTLQKTYSEGLFFLFVGIGMGLSMFLTGFFVAPRMGEFLGTISMAEALGKLYGKYIRWITAFMGIIKAIGFIAAQFLVLGGLISTVMDVNPTFSIIVSGAIVTLYSTTGGIKAVTFTDIVQIFTFGAMLPILAAIVWAGLFTDATSFDLQTALSEPKYNISYIFSMENPDFGNMIMLLILFILPGVNPAIAQRLFMAKDLAQLQKVLYYSALVFIMIELFIVWTGFLVFEHNPNNIEQDVVELILYKYGKTGLKGMLIVGVIAMVMSTADSYINSSAVLFANDICHPFNLSSKFQLTIAKLFSCFLGILGIVLAIAKPNIWDLIRIVGLLFAPTAGLTFIIAMMGFRTKAQAIFAGMLAAVCCIVLTRYIFEMHYAGAEILSLLANFSVTMAVHYTVYHKSSSKTTRQEDNAENIYQEFMKKHCAGFESQEDSSNRLGWGQNENNEYLEALRKSRREWWEEQKNIFWFYINPKNWKKKRAIALFYSQVPKYDGGYVQIGVYALFTLIPSLCQLQMLGIQGDIETTTWLFTISGLLLAMTLASYPIWPLTINHNHKRVAVALVWYPITFYLVFVHSFCFLASGQDALQTMILFITIVCMSYIFNSWKLILIYCSAGMYFAIQIYKLYAGSHGLLQFHNNISETFALCYGGIIFVIILVFVVRPKMIFAYNAERTIRTLQFEIEDGHKEVSDKYEQEKQRAEGLQAAYTSLGRQLEERTIEADLAIQALVDQRNIHKKLQTELTEVKEQSKEQLKQNEVELQEKIVALNDKIELIEHYKQRDADNFKEIERLGETAQRIIQNLNHELRIPISNVMNFAELLLEAMQKENKNEAFMEDLANEVMKGSVRLSSMILNMLDLASLSAKKLELDKKKVEMEGLIKESFDAVMKMYGGESNVTVDFNLIDILVYGDENYLRQIVDNILINAIKFSRDKSVNIKITLDTEREDTVMVCTIEDDGIGIPPLEIMDVFYPFKMGSNVTSAAEGRGVGLALCKAAIEAHHGSIVAESDGEIGTKFVFKMPVGIDLRGKTLPEPKPLQVSKN